MQPYKRCSTLGTCAGPCVPGRPQSWLVLEAWGMRINCGSRTSGCHSVVPRSYVSDDMDRCMATGRAMFPSSRDFCDGFNLNQSVLWKRLDSKTRSGWWLHALESLGCTQFPSLINSVRHVPQSRMPARSSSPTWTGMNRTERGDSHHRSH